MKRFVIFILVILYRSVSAEDYVLDPIQIKAPDVSTERQKDQPEQPWTSTRTSADESLSQNIERSIPMAQTQSGGGPQSLKQWKGLSPRVSDNHVQAMGVPLSSPIGFGYDFNTFPGFLWSGAQVHLGPSVGITDPSRNRFEPHPCSMDRARSSKKTP